jgi:hypothetical protein
MSGLLLRRVPCSDAVADRNGDGHVDTIAVVDRDHDGHVDVLAVADTNYDGRPD